MRNKRLWNRIIAIVCIFLVICAPACLFISHGHTCNDEDCVICALADASKFQFSFLVVCIAFYHPPEYIYKFIGLKEQDIFLKNSTLVLEKVKLSD